MVQQWKTSGNTKPIGGTGFGAAGAVWGNGIDTAVTHYYGTTDPSLGNSWGEAELGVLWFDSFNVLGNGGDDLGLVVKRWEKLDAVPTYGWRTLGIRSYTALEPNTNVLDLVGLGDVAFTGCAVQAQTSVRAVAALLLVTVEDSAPGTDVYAAFRRPGTVEVRDRRVYPQAAGIPSAALVLVELDQAQTFEYAVEASGADTFDLRVDILGYQERG
jgi:hypothetical protein